MRRKRFILFYISRPITEGTGDRNLEQRPGMKAASRCTPSGFLEPAPSYKPGPTAQGRVTSQCADSPEAGEWPFLGTEYPGIGHGSRVQGGAA